LTCLRAHAFFDEEERREWQNPETILANLNVKKGLVFVDVGCGSGFFALPAARLVRSEGKVYGVDADPQTINRLKKKAAREGLMNLELTIGLAEETVFCSSCADIVFFGIVFHDFSDQTKALSNAKKMLKPTGRLIDLDWKKEPMRFGPPSQIRFNEEEASGLIVSAGFEIEEKRTDGPYHYVIVATPKS
jgi:ubiquinone/menaquinone biosynthesis C-methylase UbiE